LKILCVFGQYNYGDRTRGLGYEYANFIPALKNLGHEVIFFESLDKSKYGDYVELNKTLLKFVMDEKPDIIFFVLMTYEVWLETLRLIRQGTDAVLIQWATDDSWKFDQFSRFISPSFDLYATTYPSAIKKAQKLGQSNFVLSQWAACSESMDKPVPAKDCRYGVTFVGSMYGNRKKWVDELIKRGINIRCFGYGWRNGPVEAEEIPEIIRHSVVSLNFGDSGLMLKGGKFEHNRQIKARVFEVPGAGGLLLTEPADDLEYFYKSDKEIVLFNSIDELCEKINYLLSHQDERDAIALAGFTRTKREHTYEGRFKVLIEKALEFRKHNPKTNRNLDLEQFDQIKKTHKINFLHKMVRGCLVLPCILIWGKKRGPRAARRILFEISWRLLGHRTYSVKGLPGRLFYRAS